MKLSGVDVSIISQATNHTTGRSQHSCITLKKKAVLIKLVIKMTFYKLVEVEGSMLVESHKI